MKLYVVVRSDLTAGQQAVQAMHALADFAVAHPWPFKEWQSNSNTLVLLQVPDAEALWHLSVLAAWTDIARTPFYEPDLDDTLTAVAFEPNQYLEDHMLAGLPLALPARRRWLRWRS